jgi:hypothetical protein
MAQSMTDNSFPRRWPFWLGRHADIFLTALAGGVCGAFLIVLVLPAKWLPLGVYRFGGYRDEGAFAAWAIVLPVAMAGMYFVGRVLANYYESRHAKRLGQVLDGLWLPKLYRLGMWSGILLGVGLTVYYSRHWAPKSPERQEREETAEFEEATTNVAIGPERGEKILEVLKKYPGAGAEIKTDASGVSYLPPQPSPPRAGQKRSPSTGRGGEGTGPEDPPWAPRPRVPVKLVDNPTPVGPSERRNDSGGSINKALPFPLKVILAILGWGSGSKRHSQEMMAAIGQTLQGYPLTKDQIAELLTEVYNKKEWKEEFLKVIAEAEAQGTLSAKDADEFRRNLSESVSEAMAKDRPAEERLAESAAKAAKAAIDKAQSDEEVVKLVKSRLPQGGFPSEEFAADLKAKLEKMLPPDRGPKIWEALMTMVNGGVK